MEVQLDRALLALDLRRRRTAWPERRLHLGGSHSAGHSPGSPEESGLSRLCCGSTAPRRSFRASAHPLESLPDLTTLVRRSGTWREPRLRSPCGSALAIVRAGRRCRRQHLESRMSRFGGGDKPIEVDPSRDAGYKAGHRRFTWLDVDRGRPVWADVWYPSTDEPEEQIVPFGLGQGRALPAASVAADGAPFPLVIMSHGASGSAPNYAWLAAVPRT